MSLAKFQDERWCRGAADGWAGVEPADMDDVVYMRGYEKGRERKARFLLLIQDGVLAHDTDAS